MSHTPGPWAVDGPSGNDGEAETIVAADGSRIIAWTANTFDDAADDGYGAEIVTDEDRANARLIVAAPDLLAACELLIALEDNDAHEFDTRWKDARKMMREAIAAAKGAANA